MSNPYIEAAKTVKQIATELGCFDSTVAMTVAGQIYQAVSDRISRDEGRAADPMLRPCKDVTDPEPLKALYVALELIQRYGGFGSGSCGGRELTNEEQIVLDQISRALNDRDYYMRTGEIRKSQPKPSERELRDLYLSALLGFKE